MYKNKLKILISSPSSFSMLTQVSRLLSGPLVLLVISSELNSELLGFYFTFMNIAAMQQIMEMGVGFTITQFIAHASSSNTPKEDSSRLIYNYYNLTVVWFGFVALLILILVNAFGLWFYSDYIGYVQWLNPWLVLIASISISALSMPMQIFLEGCQKQQIVYRAKFFSSLIYSFTLLVSVLFGMELYSLGIATIVSSLAIVAMLYKDSNRLLEEYKQQGVWSVKNITNTIKEVWPMLSKISVSWILGYFFWNAFNLIAFRVLSVEIAGKLGMSLSLLRAGYSIAESLMTAKVSRISNLIASNQLSLSITTFSKTFKASFGVLISGYTLAFSLLLIIDIRFISEKILDSENLFWLMLYFVLLLPITLQASYCRAFKCEPYVFISLLMNICMPILFYFSCLLIPRSIFMPLCILNLFCLFWSCAIFSKYRLLSV